MPPCRSSAGIDLSHYDGPDSRKAVDEGYAFLTHKAGGDANDAEIGQWWTLMEPYRGRVLLGAYWVLYPGNPAGRADAFLTRLDATCPGWRDGPFILQADCEIWNSDPGTKPGKADIGAFCDRLHARMPKLTPIVYAPKWAYGDSLTGLSYPLWASSYVTGAGPASALYPGDTSSRWNPYSGQTPAILQFTSSAVIAGQTTCDANAYRGTLAQLTALLAPGWEDDMAEGLELDKVPIAYPSVSATNPTWTGWNALGAARDLSHETRDRVKAVQGEVAAVKTQVGQLLAAVTALAGQDTTDEQAIAAAVADAVLEGLGGKDVSVVAQTLRAVWTADKLAALAAQLTAGT